MRRRGGSARAVRAATMAPPREEPAPVVLYGDLLVVRDRRPSPWRPHLAVAVAFVASIDVFLLNITPALVVDIGVATVLGLQTTVAVDRGRRLAEELARPLSVARVGYAVADALHEAGLSPVGSSAVRVTPDVEGGPRCTLDGADADVSLIFAATVHELLWPSASSSYVVPRWSLAGPVDNAHGARAALGRLRPDVEVWHAVPMALATSQAHADSFARAFDRWVGGGVAVRSATVRAQHRVASREA
jgi:hypothetical protein